MTVSVREMIVESIIEKVRERLEITEKLLEKMFGDHDEPRDPLYSRLKGKVIAFNEVLQLLREVSS